MKKGKSVRPPNLGWIEYELNQKELDYVWRCVESAKGDYRDKLAGCITSSMKMVDRGDWFYQNVIRPLVDQYAKDFRSLGIDAPLVQRHPYTMGQWWVNYQRQNEFNPLHSHTGIYSFVIWLKVPTHYNQQSKLPIAHKSNSGCISNFELLYADILGRNQMHNFPMDPSMEGKMLLFPSKLMHCVYPFYNCEEERVSVSGNILINTAKQV